MPHSFSTMDATASTPSTAAADASRRLRMAGIQPTRQRIAIAQVMLLAPAHMTADEVLVAARIYLPNLSRATVYNTLPMLVQKGLLRALRMNADCTIYDSRTDVHSHIYHEDTGLLEDLPAHLLQWPSMPPIATGLELVGLDLIVRVRQQRRD